MRFFPFRFDSHLILLISKLQLIKSKITERIRSWSQSGQIEDVPIELYWEQRPRLRICRKTSSSYIFANRSHFFCKLSFRFWYCSRIDLFSLCSTVQWVSENMKTAGGWVPYLVSSHGQTAAIILRCFERTDNSDDCVASYVIFTLIPPPDLRIELSEVAITLTCSIPVSVLIPCHLSLQLLPTVAYTGYTAACTVAYVFYAYNWRLAVMNRIPKRRSIQCIVTLPLIRSFW